MARYLFRTPTRPNPRYNAKSTKAQKGLYKHFVVAPVGIALLKNGGTWTESNLPTHDELEASDLYYLGGRDYIVEAAEAAELTAAGYGANLTSLTPGELEDGLAYLDEDGRVVFDPGLSRALDEPVYTGINAQGRGYYNPAGATPGEEASVGLDENGRIVFTLLGA